MTYSDLTIIDTVSADSLEEGDQITFRDRAYVEIMTVRAVVDEGDSILITGDSWQSGDKVTYILDPDRTVDLWTA